MTILISSVIIVGYFIIRRNFPVSGLRHVHVNDLNLDTLQVVDIRDFNESYDSPISVAINIPIAYLHRNHTEISNCEVHVIASNVLEKNIGIRYLRKKGFRVKSYTMMDNRNFLIEDKHLSKETCY